MKLDEIAILDPKQKEKTQTQKPKMYICILHNDPFTHAHRVVDLLKKYFNHGEQAAMTIMVQAHRLDKAPCGGPYTKDVAESKAKNAMDEAKKEEFPLLITIDEVGA
jgi:ATP-dependent Clp protease adaptor protein ClpS